MPTAKEKALAAFEQRFDKTFGEGKLLTGDDERPYSVIPTGSISLDYAMGVGGYVVGRISEVWGADDVGKSSLAMHGVHQAQRLFPDRLAGWINMEHKWDWPWARVHKINSERDRLKVVDPESAEEVADQMKEMCRSGLFSVVVLDSIGAMIPEAEKEKDADAAVVAAQAKIVTRMVKIATVEAHRNDVAVVLINQVRANIGSFTFEETTTGGGFALKHVSTHKIKLRKGQTFKISVDGKQQEVGHIVAAQVERNKVAPPKKRAEFTIIHTPSVKFGPVGLDRVDEAVTMGLKTGVIEQSGGSYTMPTGEKLKGREKIVEALHAEPALVDDIRERVLATISGSVVTGDDAEVLIEPPEDQEETPAVKGNGTGAFRKVKDLIDG